LLLDQVVQISSFLTTIPDGWPGGRVLEETKLRLTQPSLVELGLGLSLAKTSLTNRKAFFQHFCHGMLLSYKKISSIPLRMLNLKS
jgi:hypothetical protein